MRDAMLGSFKSSLVMIVVDKFSRAGNVARTYDSECPSEDEIDAERGSAGQMQWSKMSGTAQTQFRHELRLSALPTPVAAPTG